MAAGLSWGIGHSGAQGIGANGPDLIVPGIFFGKGFGDLPNSLAATLRNHRGVHARTVTCASRGQDRYGRTLATCSAGGESLNAWMVREGWALAYVQYSRQYVGDEAAARAQHRAMWAGAFIAPWDWRHRDKHTVILRTPRNRCVCFVFGVAAASRNTRFQAAC